MSKFDDFAGFEEAEVSSQIAQRVFETEFTDLQKRLDRQESLSINIMIGSVVALFFILAGLIWGAWTFIGEYNQHYLDAQKSFQEEIGSLKLENFKTQEMIKILMTEVQNQE